MKKLEFTAKNTHNIWFSLTGYRILLILKSLMRKGCTVNKLIDTLKKDKYANKSISKDTVRVAINTLKKAGCIISRPSKANDYKYELLYHPFTFTLTDAELKVFLRLRDKLTQEMQWEEVLTLNDVYEKIISLTCNEEQVNQVKNSMPLVEINKQILKEILNPSIIGKKVRIIYNSPEFNEEELDIIPHKISYENNKLYLWCYSYKYKIVSLLNIERITKIVSIDISQSIETSTVYDVIYTVTGDSVKTFELKEFEEVVERTESRIKVLAHVENEFYFIQRLLLFGSDFKIVFPDFFKEKLINKIKLIQKGYEE